MNTSETIPPLEKKLPWYSSKLFRGLAVFLAVILWFGLFAWWGVDWHHDGIMLAPVKQILEQKVLFRDVFCQYGPLAVWIQCIPASLFGAETLVIRLTTVLFYGFIKSRQRFRVGFYALSVSLYAFLQVREIR